VLAVLWVLKVLRVLGARVPGARCFGVRALGVLVVVRRPELQLGRGAGAPGL